MADEPYLFYQRETQNIDSPLLRFKRNFTSQCGEDGIVEKIFELTGTRTKFCVEFGAWDGKHLSNCCNLIVNHGWSACMIEASEQKHSLLAKNYASNSRVRCINQYVDFEGENRLDRILSESGVPQEFDLLSIDVDGIDYFIWQGLEHFMPGVVIIEFNPTIPNDVVFVQPRNKSVNQGCSLLSLILLGKSKGYELACCTKWNAFFVRNDLFPKIGLRNNAIGRLYKPVQDGRIFQGFDSRIYVTGMDRLLWSKVELSNDDFQVLPKSLQKFSP